MITFADHGIEIPTTSPGPEVQTMCPKCSGERRKKNAKCLSVNTEKRCWVCHHCGWTGGLPDTDRSRETCHWNRPKYRRPDPRPQLTLTHNAVEWFRSRGITDDVLLRNRIDYGSAYMPPIEEHAEAVIFPYFRNGGLVTRKYRTIKNKHFRLEAGCELVLYELDDIEPEKALIWVEGECDKLALEVAGYRNVVSVPNGAPPPCAKNYSALLRFLDADREKIEAVKHHIIAVDADAPGAFLENELVRRLGVEQCSHVQWPEGCKDANELLIKHGAEELRWYIENAQPFPIEGVFEISDRLDALVRLYERGFERGYKTGWSALDAYYTCRPGEVTVITGIPGSGKSNLIDCLDVNLALLHGWSFAFLAREFANRTAYGRTCREVFQETVSSRANDADDRN
jgi:twinkle protein